MRKLIFVLLILGLTTFACAELKVSGKKTVYELTGRTLTEGIDFPTNVTEGERFRNIEENELYIYKNGVWKLDRKTLEIEAAIADYKAQVALVENAQTRRAIKSLGKLVLKIYKEQE